MKTFNLTATVEISMEIEAEDLENAAMRMDEKIYDLLDSVNHSVDSIDED